MLQGGYEVQCVQCYNCTTIVYMVIFDVFAATIIFVVSYTNVRSTVFYITYV